MEFVNGKDDIPYVNSKNKIHVLCTNQLNVDFYSFLDLY